MRIPGRLAGPVVLIALAGAGALTGCSPERVNPSQAYIDARTTILEAADAKDPTTRIHAIEALSETLGQQAGGVYMQALKDPDAGVRLVAAIAIGDVRYEPALPTLLKMGKSVEWNRMVFCGVIYALFRLGDDTHTGELGGLLLDEEKTVRRFAAMAMGKMGERAAIRPLETLYGDEQDDATKLQIVESLAMLGERRYQGLLEAYTKSQFMDDHLIAIMALQRIGSARAKTVIRNLMGEEHPPRVRVAAAGGLAQLGEIDEAGYDLCVQAARSPQSLLKGEKIEGTQEVDERNVKSLQRLAVMSLGWMKHQDAVGVLHPLLKDRDSGVRVAAAMSILRLLPGYASPPPKAPAPAATKPAAKDKPAPKRTKMHSAGAKD